MNDKKPIFRSAVTGEDGEIDSGYLALFALMFVVCGAIPVVAIVGGIAAVRVPEQAGAIVTGIGIGIGSICGGFGVSLAALGAFRLGDRPHLGTTTTTTASQATTEVSGPPDVAAAVTRSKTIKEKV